MRSRALMASLAAFVLGGAGFLVGLLRDPRGALFAWLAAFAFAVSTAIGAQLVVMTAHAARARWLVAVRRLAELPMATLPVFFLLVIPILAGARHLYPWTGPLTAFPEELRDGVAHKLGWLNMPFFVGRSLFYLAVLSVFAAVLLLGSVRQYETVEGGRQLFLRKVSTAGLPIVALVLTFASFDWFMSLDPTWLSSVYGVYVFAGGFLAALALMQLVSLGLRRNRLLPDAIGIEHDYANGKLLLAMVIFWAYIAFVQLLIIWTADIPREISFYEVRSRGGWAAGSAALGLCQFALPFLVLLSREVKRRPALLAAVSVWLLLAHFLDACWLVLPGHATPVWLAAAALLCISGALGVPLSILAGRIALVARGDPYFEQALRYRGT